MYCNSIVNLQVQDSETYGKRVEMERTMSIIGKMVLLFLSISIIVPGGSRASEVELLSLEECINTALKNNPDMGISFQYIRKAESDLMTNYGNLLPDLKIDFYSGHNYYGPSSVQYDSQGRPIQTDGFDYENYTLRLSSNLILWEGGRNYSGINSARNRNLAAREDYNYSKDIMIAKVIRSYYGMYRNKMLLVVQKESKEQAEKNLDRSKALFEAGSGTRVDVLKAQVRYSNTRLDVIKARNALEMAREELKALMNRRKESLFSVDTSMTIEYSEPEFQDEIEFALANRADLKSMGYNLEAAKAGISAARAGWWPSFGLNFNYYWNDRELVDNPLDIFREEYQWSITGLLSFNIFDRMATSARVKSARADYRIAEYNLEKSNLDAVKEIKNLFYGMNEARERIEVAHEIVKQATEELRLAEERYSVGAGTMLETIDSQVALTTAKGDLIKAKCDYLAAEADLARAAGKMSR